MCHNLEITAQQRVKNQEIVCFIVFLVLLMLLYMYIHYMYQFKRCVAFFNGLVAVDKFQYNKEYKYPTFDFS